MPNRRAPLSPASRSLRLVFIGAAVIVFALLAVFAYSLADSQHRQRRDVEKRFHDRATVSAALTEAVFASSAAQNRRSYALRFGGPKIDPALLARVRQRDRSLYARIVAANGRVLQATRGAPPMDATTVALAKRALPSARIQLTDLLPGPAGTQQVVTALSYPSRSGRRVAQSGIVLLLLDQFLSSFLRSIPNVADAHSYVIDGRGRVIATTGTSAKAGTLRPDKELAQAVMKEPSGGYGDGRHFTSAPIAGSAWRVVLSASNQELNSSINGGRRAIPWVIFAAFAIAAIAGLLLLRRVLLTSRQLERAEINRSHALEINDNVVQRLVMAKYELDRGSHETSQARIDETLHETQHLVTKLLEEKGISPGALRRDRPADTEGPPPLGPDSDGHEG